MVVSRLFTLVEIYQIPPISFCVPDQEEARYLRYLHLVRNKLWPTEPDTPRTEVIVGIPILCTCLWQLCRPCWYKLPPFLMLYTHVIWWWWVFGIPILTASTYADVASYLAQYEWTGRIAGCISVGCWCKMFGRRKWRNWECKGGEATRCGETTEGKRKL